MYPYHESYHAPYGFLYRGVHALHLKIAIAIGAKYSVLCINHVFSGLQNSTAAGAIARAAACTTAKCDALGRGNLIDSKPLRVAFQHPGDQIFAKEGAIDQIHTAPA